MVLVTLLVSGCALRTPGAMQSGRAGDDWTRVERLRPDTWVRIDLHTASPVLPTSAPIEGRIGRVTADTVALQPSLGTPRTIPRTDVSSVAVVSSEANIRGGFGLTIGLVAGARIALANSGGRAGQDYLLLYSLGAGALGGVIGTASGLGHSRVTTIYVAPVVPPPTSASGRGRSARGGEETR